MGASYAVWGAGASRLTAAAALKLPTGQWKVPNTYDEGLHDPMLQPGTGSFGYLLAALYSHGGARLSWAASGSYQIATATTWSTASGTRPSWAWASRGRCVRPLSCPSTAT